MLPCFLFAQLNTAKPWAYWWWMGSAVNKADIHKNLEDYAAAGFGGMHIIPIYGVKGEEAHFIPYLSPKWLEMLDYTCSEAKKLAASVRRARHQRRARPRAVGGRAGPVHSHRRCCRGDGFSHQGFFRRNQRLARQAQMACSPRLRPCCIHEANFSTRQRYPKSGKNLSHMLFTFLFLN